MTEPAPYDGPGSLPLVHATRLHQVPHPFDTAPPVASDADAVDRLLMLCQQAARSGPDPQARLLRAQAQLVQESHTDLAKTRTAITDRGELPELSRGFREVWAHCKGASDVYDVAVRRATAVGTPSGWDAKALHATLIEQARVVKLLHAEHTTARESGDTDVEPFARHARAQTVFLAGVHAVVDLSQGASARLGVALTVEVPTW